MAWCVYCRREADGYPPDPCPTCGYQLMLSTPTTIQADALAQLSGQQTPPTTQVVNTPAPPTVIYQQVLIQPRQRPERQESWFWKAQLWVAALLVIGGAGGYFLSQHFPDPASAKFLGGAAMAVGVIWYLISLSSIKRDRPVQKRGYSPLEWGCGVTAGIFLTLLFIRFGIPLLFLLLSHPSTPQNDPAPLAHPAQAPELKPQFDADGNLPIHRAVIANDLPEMSKLIESGADVNAKTQSGRTALGLAREMYHFDAARILVRFGASKNANEP